MTKSKYAGDPKILHELAEVTLAEGMNKNSGSNGKYIYINLSMVRMQTAWIYPKLLYAKGVAEKTGAGIIALYWREDPCLKELLDSFGIELICIDNEIKKHFGAFLKTVFKTAAFMITDGSGEGLLKLKSGRVPVGASIYEDILRTSSFSTLRSCRNKTCLRKITHLLWMYYSLEKVLRKKKPILMIADDVAYHEWMIEALFHEKGAKIRRSDEQIEEDIYFEDNLLLKRRAKRLNECVHELIDTTGDEMLEDAEKYIEERFKGKNGIAIDRQAFKGKKVMEKEDIVKALKLDPEKKNAVILAHTFSDAVFGYGMTYFRDYYDWCDKTLEMASKIDNVNWILKPHPSRKSYNESKDSIEKMFERHKSANMYFMSDEYSAENLGKIADVIITIGGNGGAESACRGVPALIVGHPFYKGFGYTMEPANIEEYKQMLENLDKVERLNEEQIKTAKKVFYMANCKHTVSWYFKDEFALMIRKKYEHMFDEMALQYFESDKGTEKYNDEITESIIEYAKTHDLRLCQYYQRGKDSCTA